VRDAGTRPALEGASREIRDKVERYGGLAEASITAFGCVEGSKHPRDFAAAVRAIEASQRVLPVPRGLRLAEMMLPGLTTGQARRADGSRASCDE
jgi:hypothetical protein